MVIKEFGAINFRNFKDIFLKFSDKVNLITGENGQGKTNLVEGIYFLNHLDSFRTHKLEDLIAFEASLSYIQGTVVKNEFSQKAKIELSKRGRRAWLDENPIQKHSYYISLFHALIFNPDSLYNYRHYPSERRQFYDRFLSFINYEYFGNLKSFKNILSQKNKLLKLGDISSLPAWNQLLIEKAYDIIKFRSEMSGNINDYLGKLYKNITGMDSGLLLRYLPSLKGEKDVDLQMLTKVQQQEVNAGHALYGPHRDDFQLISGNGTKENFFSQGEYRIALLTLKMAFNELLVKIKGFRPVIILDDVFSELDQTIKTNLTEYLFHLNNQIFITATQIPDTQDLTDYRIMEIREGTVV